ncbi:MAG TPA: putative quinol monooxygenase [Chthoniobacterales bacterium]
MSKIRVIARAVAQPGQETKVRELLQGMLAPTRAEAGCEFYELFESHEPGTFYFYELWESRAALDRHAATPHFLSMVAGVKDRLAAPFEVSLVRNLGEES